MNRFLSVSKWILTCTLFFSVAWSQPGEIPDDAAAGCGQVVLPISKVTLSYCVQQGTPEDSLRPGAEVFYLFHGIGGSARAINSAPFPAIASQARGSLKDRAPVFIGLSTGMQGILKNYSAEVLATGLPQVEQLVLGGSSGRKHVGGFSMGGHNAARLVAENAQAFASVSLLCPALLPIDPFNAQELADYQERHKDELDTRFFNMIVGVFRREFPTPAIWAANNPFELIKQGRYTGTSYFVSTGLQDSLGFEEGSEAFVVDLVTNGIPVVSAPITGGHCVFDVPALTTYLMQSFATP